MKISDKKKIEGKLCCAYSCKNKPVKKKGGLCHKHFARLEKERDPVRVRYNHFKNNAKRRGKEFHISLEEFRKFCERTGYLKNGKRGKIATIDRMCNIHGYHIWNIQLLTNRENARKGNRFNGNNFYYPF